MMLAVDNKMFQCFHFFVLSIRKQIQPLPSSTSMSAAISLSFSEQNWIARHVFSLARFLRTKLAAMRHQNGAPVAVLYPPEASDSWRQQGGIVAFNLLRDDGSHIGFSQVRAEGVFQVFQS